MFIIYFLSYLLCKSASDCVTIQVFVGAAPGCRADGVRCPERVQSQDLFSYVSQRGRQRRPHQRSRNSNNVLYHSQSKCCHSKHIQAQKLLLVKRVVSTTYIPKLLPKKWKQNVLNDCFDATKRLRYCNKMYLIIRSVAYLLITYFHLRFFV